MAWIFLLLAGLFEIVWAFLIKASDGFSKPWATVGAIGFMIVSFGLLSMAMKTLPLGTAYAIWTGIGAVGAFIVGVMVMGEALTPLRVAGVVLIVSGLVVLKLASSH
ncbi:MAG: multidrug efflux SMR transporter [Brevundimonas sp.]|uniref:DMT family transporter n=1 Tax=Brevundimonas sp. TaxID=1871086 RepID=UPI001221F381|nr:multidrug efflux SMR transporter [Brevundimonas sp.]RZJ18663.1 MAG: multidrug efflux SMR transporter [Brevundimonas sp.]